MPAAQPTPAAPSTEALEEALVFCESSAADAHEPVYCRTWSRAREQLEAALLALYGLDADHHHALIVPSGLSAIAAVMASVAASHPHEDWVLVHGDELYCDVPCTVQYLVEAHAPHVARVAVDVRDREALLGLFAARGPSIRLFHFEACTNPSGQLFDFRLLERLRGHAPDCRFVCDNTWLSAALFDPFRRGVDVVVESLTKYVSGGRCIGGAVLGPNGALRASCCCALRRMLPCAVCATAVCVCVCVCVCYTGYTGTPTPLSPLISNQEGCIPAWCADIPLLLMRTAP